jgi:hypothetical protein
LVNPCALPSIGQTWVLASNDAVFEMGDFIRALKRLLMESSTLDAKRVGNPCDLPQNGWGYGRKSVE